MRFFRNISIQLRAGGDVRVYHEQMQLFFLSLMMYGGDKHTAGFNAHHRSRREVCYGYAGLADKLFRLIVRVNAGENCAVCAGSVVESEL